MINLILEKPSELFQKAFYRKTFQTCCVHLKANSYIKCRSHAVSLPCRAAKDLYCVFLIWFTQCGRGWFTHAMPRPYNSTTMPFLKRFIKATAQCGMVMAWHVWFSIGRPETAWGRTTHVRLLPATTRTFTKKNSMGGSWHVRINAVRHGRGTAWHVWISLKCTLPNIDDAPSMASKHTAVVTGSSGGCKTSMR
jgi:hypothetical protein